MKVVILCSNYEPGGAQRLSLKLHDAFVQKGFDTESWYLHRKYKNFSKEDPKIILNKKIRSIKDVVLSLVKLYHEIKKTRPDIILTSLPYANTLGLFVAFLCGVKVRIASHHNESYNELNRLTKPLDYLCASFGVYTNIVAVSEPTRKSFSYYPQKIFNEVNVINNGINFVKPLGSKEKYRNEFGFENNVFVIGAIGRLVNQKNHQFLIELLPKLEGVFLVIVGKGELKKELIHRAKELGVIDSLKIIDEIETHRVPEFLKAIDVYIMPSIFEGLSVSILEALHAGLPIISSNIPSQKNVLYNSDYDIFCGHLIDLDKPEEWIAIILRLRDNEKELKKLSDLSLKRAKDFTLENMTSQYLELFN